jgi:hypothetical protein
MAEDLMCYICHKLYAKSYSTMSADETIERF